MMSRLLRLFFKTVLDIRTVTPLNSVASRGSQLTKTRGEPWALYFYFFMSLLIAVVVVYGFSQTIDMNLIHPAIPRPFLLYVHAAVFTGWLLFFLLQSAALSGCPVGLRPRSTLHIRATPFSAYIGGVDLNGDGIKDDLLPGTTVDAFNRGCLGRADLERLVVAFNGTHAGSKD